MASAGSSFPSAPPQSLVTPTPPQSSGTQAPLQTLVTVAPSRSSVSAVLLGSISSPSLPWDPLTSAMSPLDVVGHVNTLASPSIVILAVLWGCNIWPLLPSSSPWLLPPSVPPWSLCLSACLFSPALCLLLSRLSPAPHPPPKPLQSLPYLFIYGVRSCFPGGGRYVTVIEFSLGLVSLIFMDF